MSKRFLAILLSLVMLFSLVSVAGGEASSDPTNIYGGLAPLDDAGDPITFTILSATPARNPRLTTPC